MVKEQYLEDYNSLVGYIAYEYAKRYRMVDVQDIRQELWLWFFSRPNKLKDWYENFEPRDRDKLISRSLRNAAQKYCNKEKAKAIGYESSDMYFYEPAVIEEFMPYILTDSYSLPVGVNDVNYKPDTNSIAENNTWLAVRTDISKAFEVIHERHQNVLRLRFGSLTTTLKDVAQELSISPDAARKRVDRAIAALIEELGGRRPYADNDYGNQG